MVFTLAGNNIKTEENDQNEESNVQLDAIDNPYLRPGKMPTKSPTKSSVIKSEAELSS